MKMSETWFMPSIKQNKLHRSRQMRGGEQLKKRKPRPSRTLSKVCPNGLMVPKMKALVAAATTATDSPVKSRKAELQAQLYREP
jgi:hypothetical protein